MYRFNTLINVHRSILWLSRISVLLSVCVCVWMKADCCIVLLVAFTKILSRKKISKFVWLNSNRFTTTTKKNRFWRLQLENVSEFFFIYYFSPTEGKQNSFHYFTTLSQSSYYNHCYIIWLNEHLRSVWNEVESSSSSSSSNV